MKEEMEQAVGNIFYADRAAEIAKKIELRNYEKHSVLCIEFWNALTSRFRILFHYTN